MCTYIIEKTPLVGSGKGANGWFNVTDAMVYYDHPFHAPMDHTLNIDFNSIKREPIELKVNVPLLGIFGNDDASPSPDEVNKTEELLKQSGKNYEFHRYDGAGHSFFAVDRPSYRVEQAQDAWKKVFAFYDKYLSA